MKYLIKQMLVAAVLVVGAQLPLAHAATHTWTGAGANEYWNTAANWSGGAPVAGEAAPVTLVFPGGVITTNNIAGLTVDLLQFTGNFSVLHGSGSGSLTFRGAGGTNFFASGAAGASNHLASTLPLTLSGSNYFVLGESHSLGIFGGVSGSGIVTYRGLGSTVYYGGTQANTASGLVRLADGCWLCLGKTAGVNAIAGPVRIGENNCRLLLKASNQIADSAAVTVTDLGVFDLGGFDDTVGNVTVNLGEVSTGAGLLTLNGTIIPVSGGNTIWGRLSLGGVTRTINATANDSLTIRANISHGVASAGLTKTGAGTLILWGTNTFTGPVSVNAGTLEVYRDGSLGSAAGGTTILPGATLRLMGVNLGAEPITLHGELDIYGTNSAAGPVSVASESVLDLNGTSSQMTFSGVISGGGSLTKVGTGTLVFSGALANTFTGGLAVLSGNVGLGKSGAVALPGPLQISGGTVTLLQANQIADSAAVTVQIGAMLSLNNFVETIGSLAGGGSVNVGVSTLATGGNNSSSTFSGVIYGVGAAPLVKNGNGYFTLTGTNACTGSTTVNGGALVVDGELPGIIVLNNSATLFGSGKVGNLNSSAGNVHPGGGIGKLTAGNISMSSAATSMNFDIAGTAPGSGHDQIVANGVVALNNVSLNVSATGAGAIGNQYVLIANDGADAISGTFNGLAEGATVTVGLLQYSISYHGGTGNDVVLTQIAAPPTPTITQLTKLPDGQMQLLGKGIDGYMYQIQANPDLSTTNWSVLGGVAANWNGDIQFTDAEAANYPQRYYRLKMQ